MTKIFCAVDVSDLTEAERLVERLKGSVSGIKLGLEFFIANGTSGVERLRTAMGGAEFFLDLKLHDIPNTVAGAVKSAGICEADFLTVHASGGLEMMQAAVKAAGKTKILAVTVLTALSDDDIASIGQKGPAAEQVLRLAKLAVKAGVSGVVCSPKEITLLRKELPKGFLLVVPGIRPAGTEVGDQKRVMTPQEAAQLGADYLVIGRPITAANDPAAAAKSMLA
jgi:orotidine-5'-phosphate decarboxylase